MRLDWLICQYLLPPLSPSLRLSSGGQKGFFSQNVVVSFSSAADYPPPSNPPRPFSDDLFSLILSFCGMKTVVCPLEMERRSPPSPSHEFPLSRNPVAPFIEQRFFSVVDSTPLCSTSHWGKNFPLSRRVSPICMAPLIPLSFPSTPSLSWWWVCVSEIPRPQALFK